MAIRPIVRMLRCAGLRVGALAFAFVAGCGAYTLEGRVVRGSYSGIMLVPADDPRLAERGIGGVAVTVVRDADKPNRQQVASASSAADGSITLPISGFGAGITEEQWLFSAGRSNSDRLEAMLSLPVSSGSMRLLVMMTRAELAPRGSSADEPNFAPTIGDEIERDLKKYSW